ncbi:hypothetical protein GJ496_005944 [Pomphorhynchus laevis]|nr:hypothetical protein GJ496_005944 [Pomphorhynchus laevis]
MGERKGQNKYYPPDFDWKVHPSLNAYHGTHALRERARKLDRGILIIRFEMPFNIWCEKCDNHIGMGVRYNAEKSKVGMYYTTPLWRFRMKCHLCDNHFEIDSDPKNFTYVIKSGARREELRWDAKDNEQIVPDSEGDKQLMAVNPMYKVQHKIQDEKKASVGLPDLDRLEHDQMRWKDDYKLNCVLRDKFRNDKLSIRNENSSIASNGIRLLPELEDDIKYAARMFYDSKHQKSPQVNLKTKIACTFNSFGDIPTMPEKKRRLVTSQLKAGDETISLFNKNTPSHGIVKFQATERPSPPIIRHSIVSYSSDDSDKSSTVSS